MKCIKCQCVDEFTCFNPLIYVCSYCACGMGVTVEQVETAEFIETSEGLYIVI